MAAAASGSKARVKTILAAMEKKYGSVKTIGTGSSLTQCIFQIFRQGWDFKKASRAVRILESSFIDWNEVRISPVRELTEALTALKCADMDSRVERVKGFLQEVFDGCQKQDENLFHDMDYESIRRLLMSNTALGRAAASVFLQILRFEMEKQPDPGVEDKLLVVSPETMRVAIRIGFLKKTQSSNVARQEFEKFIQPKEYLRFQYLTVLHAEKYCFSKNPSCADCFLSKSCAFFKKS